MIGTLGLAFLAGILSILSLGEWSDYYPLDFIPAFEGKTIFDALDFLAANMGAFIGDTSGGASMNSYTGVLDDP